MKHFKLNKKQKLSKTNIMKKRCYKLLNPCDDILSQWLLKKKPKKFLNINIIDGVKYTKKLKKHILA